MLLEFTTILTSSFMTSFSVIKKINEVEENYHTNKFFYDIDKSYKELFEYLLTLPY